MTEITGRQAQQSGLPELASAPQAERVTLFVDLPEMVSVPRVADALGVCERTVRREIAKGRLGCVHIGRAVRITRDQLAAYVAAMEG